MTTIKSATLYPVCYDCGSVQTPIPTAPADGKEFSLLEIQAMVHGYVELLTLDDGTIMLFNEDGQMKNFKYNAPASLISQTALVGNVLHCLPKQFP
ncbi:hypothetical protein [uncultured Mediterranean phage]|nr:hypothetical protein [uncultured Mediterranean phage]